MILIPSMTPTNAKSDLKKEKQAAIFDAACKVIRDKGFHQARMADIAREAGISYGLVYHYFNSKNDLFDALIEEWWTGLDQLTDRLLAQPIGVRERLGRLAGYFFDQYEKRPDLVHIFVTEFSRSTANLTPERLGRFKNMLDATRRIIVAGQEEGAVRIDMRPSYLAYFFLGSLEAFLSAMVLENQPITDGAMKDRLTSSVVTMFFEGVGPVSSSSK
jgi:AcrR family transcriptional regulator